MGLAKALRIAAAAAFALVASASAHAGLFDDDEARRQINQLREELSQQSKDNEARIQKLEDQVSHIGVVELVQQIEQMNEQIARLRGQIEVLENENQQLQKRQRDFYLDLDSRLKRVEGGNAGGAAAATSSSASSPGAAGTAGAGGAASSPSTGAGFGPAGPAGASDAKPQAQSREDQAREMKSYDAASNLFRRNDFSSAVDAFRAFLKDYPDSALAPNASYWIGISYANLKDYPKALAAQHDLLDKHPQSAKAPDALLAIAAIQSEQGQAGAARNTLEDLIARYPSSDAAGKARTRLTALRR